MLRNRAEKHCRTSAVCCISQRQLGLGEKRLTSVQETTLKLCFVFLFFCQSGSCALVNLETVVTLAFQGRRRERSSLLRMQGTLLISSRMSLKSGLRQPRALPAAYGGPVRAGMRRGGHREEDEARSDEVRVRER